MTKANGDKLYVCSITIWHPVPSSIAKGLERQCREWRQGNLSLEERELAESLTNRLANERSQLSSLLLLLPSLFGREREQLDEQILQSEERIALYNDLLKPIRTHAAAKVDGLTEGQGMWLPRCYGLLGRESGYQSVWREWLRAIAVPWVSGEVDVPGMNDKGDRFLPLDRYIVNICGEVPLPLQGRSQVEIAVRELRYAIRSQVDLTQTGYTPRKRNSMRYPTGEMYSPSKFLLMKGRFIPLLPRTIPEKHHNPLRSRPLRSPHNFPFLLPCNAGLCCPCPHAPPLPAQILRRFHPCAALPPALLSRGPRLIHHWY